MNATGLDGSTSLWQVAAHGYKGVVRQAAPDIKVNVADKVGRTALFQAVECGHKKIQDLLIKLE